MRLSENSDLEVIFARTIAGMLEFMAPDEEGFEEDFEVDYDADHVECCRVILSEHLSSMDRATTRDESLTIVKRTVVKLNGLNNKTGGQLIETDQREDICELIIKAGALKGFNQENEDITEEWRDW